MYKIAVMGDRDSVLGFKALGLDVFPCASNDAQVVLHSLAKEGYAIIYITEQMSVKIAAEIDKYKDKIMPAIILIPSKKGSLGIGMDKIRINVERAVGADILDK